jgi:hypothetical protein
VTRFTRDASLDALLGELAGRVRAHFGRDFVGAYLQGSFAAGVADASSDVDWLVVTNRELSSCDVAALEAMHRDLYGSPVEWAQHLEGSYVTAAALRAPPDGRPWWYLDNGATTLTPATHDNTWVVRWCLREQGVALAGPLPRTLVPPVPRGDLVAESLRVMGGWAREMAEHPERIETAWARAFLVIGVCRMLETLATGEVRSKASAVAFARRELGRRWTPLVEGAFACRARQARGPGAKDENDATRPDPAEVSETVAFVRRALTEAARFRAP